MTLPLIHLVAAALVLALPSLRAEGFDHDYFRTHTGSFSEILKVERVDGTDAAEFVATWTGAMKPASKTFEIKGEVSKSPKGAYSFSYTYRPAGGGSFAVIYRDDIGFEYNYKLSLTGKTTFRMTRSHPGGELRMQTNGTLKKKEIVKEFRYFDTDGVVTHKAHSVSTRREHEERRASE